MSFNLHSLAPFIVLATTLACSFAQGKSAEPPDALDLPADPVPNATVPGVAPGNGSVQSKLFVELAAGRAVQRYELGSQPLGRLSLDGRMGASLGDGLRATLSARVDTLEPEDGLVGHTVFSLREAFVSWENPTTTIFEVGRISLREGPGYGYNPTDFFRGQSLRTQVTQNPFALRENRMGSVMVRAQRRWDSGSLAIALSPKLLTERSTDAWSADLGATNSTNRALVTASFNLSERADFRWLAFREEHSSLQWGANASALLSQSVVAHAEWTTGREPSLAQLAAGTRATAERHQRAVAGLTYAAASNLSLTVERHYNGFAADWSQWRSLAANGVPGIADYLGQAMLSQESAARNAWFVYAIQRDLAVKNLDLTALGRLNQTDDSRLLWLELRYHLVQGDIALQVQHNGGQPVSEFGLPTIRNALQLIGSWFF